MNSGVTREPFGRARRPDRLAGVIQRVGRGDSAAFAELYDATSSSVYGVALTALRSPPLAAATTEEIYAEVWRTAARFDPAEGSVLAWLMSTAHRHVAERVGTTSLESPPARRAGVLGELDRLTATGGSRLDGERARRALSTLSEPHRQAVTLAYFGGYNQREVARTLGLPLGTAKAHLREGLTRLRAAMGVEP